MPNVSFIIWKYCFCLVWILLLLATIVYMNACPKVGHQICMISCILIGNDKWISANNMCSHNNMYTYIVMPIYLSDFLLLVRSSIDVGDLQGIYILGALEMYMCTYTWIQTPFQNPVVTVAFHKIFENISTIIVHFPSNFTIILPKRIQCGIFLTLLSRHFSKW